MSVRLVEAIVNGVSLWRVYINMELTRVFATKDEAENFIASIGGSHTTL
jgi:TolB-like protein